jgi:superfamily II DNA or RNA helicase
LKCRAIFKCSYGTESRRQAAQKLGRTRRYHAAGEDGAGVVAARAHDGLVAPGRAKDKKPLQVKPDAS